MVDRSKSTHAHLHVFLFGLNVEININRFWKSFEAGFRSTYLICCIKIFIISGMKIFSVIFDAFSLAMQLYLFNKY